MIKPDYIPFSQEIFDEIEVMRCTVLADPSFKMTPEFKTWALLRCHETLSDEYELFLKEQKAMEVK